MYKNQGCMVGWLSFGTTTNSEWADYYASLPNALTNQLPSQSTQGSLHGAPIYWVKNPSGSKTYPDGFSSVLEPIGSRFDTSASFSYWGSFSRGRCHSLPPGRRRVRAR